MDSRPTLVVITGPTASGKTDLALQLATRLGCEIVSADSRQIYRGMPICTAQPTAEQLAAVKHHFVDTLDLDRYYSASCFERDVTELLPELWRKSDYVVMCGGSMMYIDAVVRGIDELPTISERTRADVLQLYRDQGLEGVMAELRRVDPAYAAEVDPCNHRRIIHAIEITREAGVPVSQLRTGRVRQRPWRTVKMAIDLDRAELFNRINSRVDRMMEAGLEEEARRLWPLRHLNSLNTVGMKEMHAMMRGEMDRETAVARIAKNTRVYAKKQLTWMQRDPSIIRLTPGSSLVDRAMEAINS